MLVQVRVSYQSVELEGWQEAGQDEEDEEEDVAQKGGAGRKEEAQLLQQQEEYLVAIEYQWLI